VKLREESKCAHRIFEDQARQTPDRTALETASEAWTYAQLNAAANRVANRLTRSFGLDPDSLVGVCLPRSLRTIAVLLGVLKAGCAYVPLDVAYPEERLRFMVQDTRTPCVIADRAGSRKLSALFTGSQTVIDIDEFESESADFARPLGTYNSLAYVMYTSGSTGVPKGVMVEHRGIMRLVCNPDYMTISPDDVFVQLAPLSFDASTLEIWAPLLNGAKLIVPPPQSNSLADLAAVLSRYPVTTLWLTSGLFNALVDEYPESLRNLKQLLTGGDVLSPAHVRKAMDVMESGRVINGYGPTENTTFTCCHTVSREDTERAGIPIGRAIRGTEVYILDKDMRLVSGQQTGEIYIGGEGLARGYLNRPDLTAEKFVRNPFSPDPRSRLYRSGDLGHRNAKGEFEFDGRIDLQVKIRGFRIELPEIEAVVNAIPGVSGSAVVVKDAHSDSKRLACYYVRQSPTLESSSDIERIVRDKLPAYMVPSEFVELDQLPLNANGKVDRRALSARTSLDAPRSTRGLSFPRLEALNPHAVEVEREVTAIFGSLFHMSVGPDDDFFQLGGNSLLAARLFARIEKRFGRRLPLATVLQARTARSIAGVIQDEESNITWSSLVPLRAGGSLAPLFVVHAIGGNIVGYEDLASCLPDDQPLYALQAQGLDGIRAPCTSVPEMAARYIDAIRRVQPEGPYHLGGYSAGGVVAFDMACQLQQAGAQVSTLILIDSSIEGPVRNLSSSQRFISGYSRLLRVFQWNLAYMRQIGMHEFLAKKKRNLVMNAHIAGEQLSRRFPAISRSPFAPTLNVEEAFIEALRNYTPGHFQGSAVLLRTADAEFYSPDPELGWGSVIEGPLTIEWVTGNHDNILSRPHVEVLVEKMCAYLGNGAAWCAHTESGFPAAKTKRPAVS